MTIRQSMRTTIPGPALPTLLNNSRKCEPIGSVLWKSLDAEGREAHRIEDIPLTESGDEVVIIVRTGRPRALPAVVGRVSS